MSPSANSGGASVFLPLENGIAKSWRRRCAFTRRSEPKPIEKPE